jgi:hypothetical protein
MRARVEFRSAGTISGPLFRGLLTGGGLGNFARFIVILGTVEDANGFSFQFNDKLGNDVLDDVLTIWNLGRAIVLAGVELTLYEDMCSFGESVGHLRKRCAEGNDVMALRFFSPRIVLGLPRFLSRDAELDHGNAVREMLCFCILADKSDDRELIGSYNFVFSALLLGHPRARAAAPKPSECFVWGTEQDFTPQPSASTSALR